MALLRAMLLKDYWARLEHWRRQFERIDPADTEKLAEARVYIAEYERTIAELTREQREADA